MKKKGLLFSKKGAFDTKMGMDIGLFAIFVLGIGLTIVVETADNLTTSANGTASLTGIAATVIDYAPLIIVAVFIFGIAKLGGVI